MIKEGLARLLWNKEWDRLPALVDQEPATVRKLFSLLFDREPLLAWRAVLGFGVLARHRPDPVRRALSRLAFALNDEATICAWMNAPAVGEMAAARPALTRDVVRIIVHYFEDEETCRGTNRNVRVLCAALWAVGRVGSRDPELVREVWPTLSGFTRDREAEVRAHAWWAVGAIRRGTPDGGWSLPEFEEVETAADPVAVFDPETAEFVTQSVERFARQALEESPRFEERAASDDKG
ncbi:MAG: hypothetical protein HQL51_03120 [Magnetococcales bacterium]|nr:hypothetical protein [Magnetococcales bacterium]